MNERMTDAEFEIADRRLRSRIGWTVFLVFVAWMAAAIAVGVTYRDWFNHHSNVSQLFLVAAIVLFLTAVCFISRELQERSGLVCRTCGRKGMLSPTGECWDCNGLPKVTQKYWPVTVIIGLAGGAVGTVASRDPVRFGSLWLAGFVLVCVGVWWLRRQESKKEQPESKKEPPESTADSGLSWSVISIFVLVPVLIALGFGLVDTIGSPHAVRSTLLWLALLVAASAASAYMKRKRNA